MPLLAMHHSIDSSTLVSVPAQSPLPIQQIPKATAARIEDAQGKLVAISALVRCTNNQAYFILQHLDVVLGKKAVTVFAPDEANPLNMRIKDVYDKQTDRTFLPMYLQVHFNPDERLLVEHLVDGLIESTLGRHNFELRKNLTIDMFDSDADAFLRDNAGFFVTDRMRFQQLSVDKQEMLDALVPDPDVRVKKLEGREAIEQHEDLVKYDGTLTRGMHQRTDFLQFLFGKNTVYVAVKSSPLKELEKEGTNGVGEEDATKESDSIAGYMVVSMVDQQQILCLYADSAAVADALVAEHAQHSRAPNVVFCTSVEQWTKLRGLRSLKTRPIYRRHTRSQPTNIKWERIFVHNVGMNLF